MKRFQELYWIMEGHNPDTIPMKRLAEYMAELSKLYGQEDRVRFVRVDNKCLSLATKVDLASSGKILSRLRKVNRGEGPADAENAQQRINDMLAEDHSDARLKASGAVILRFPGTPRVDPELSAMRGPASLTGYLYQLSEDVNGNVKARIRITLPDNRKRRVDARCRAEIAREMVSCLFQDVRVTGVADWARDETGVWSPSDLIVSNVKTVSNAPITEAVQQLRALGTKWVDRPLQYQREQNREEKDG